MYKKQTAFVLPNIQSNIKAKNCNEKLFPKSQLLFEMQNYLALLHKESYVNQYHNFFHERFLLASYLRNKN